MAEKVTVTAPRRSLGEKVLGRIAASLRRRRWRRRLAAFGPGSDIEPPAHVLGGGAIRIAEGVRIWRHARIEALNPAPGEIRLAIGAGTVIQPHVHIGAVRDVTIGAEVLMASHVYITDHDHDFSDPDDPVLSNGKLLVEPVRIGDRAWLGERVMVLKGVTVGEGSVIGAGSIVTKSVPPFSVAVGAPARVVRRYDRERGEWVRAEPE